MDISPELQARFDAAAARQDNYQPSESVRRIIKNKTLVMIVAPAAMGKSFVISHALAADPRFAQTVSFTTRDPRAGDEGNMRTVPRDEQHIGTLMEMIEAGQVVNYAIFPTTGMLYGTDLMSYSGEINLMPALANSVRGLRQIGFGRTLTIGLVTDPETWRHWFNARFPEPTPEKTARLKEALLSIAWMLEDSDIRWLVNRENEPAAVVQDLVSLVKGAETDTSAAIAYAQELRGMITQMLQ